MQGWSFVVQAEVVLEAGGQLQSALASYIIPTCSFARSYSYFATLFNLIEYDERRY